MRVLDLLLVVGIVIGSVLFVRSRDEMLALDKELKKASALVGDMVVEDDSKFHAQALKDQAPWQWAWRVYLPDKCSGTIMHSSGGGSGSHGFDYSKQMLIARCSLSQTRSGSMGVYFRFAGGSSFSSFGSAEFFEFLKQNADRMQVEQLGADKVAVLEPGSQATTLLKVTMSDELAKEAHEKFGNDPNVNRLIPELMQVTIDLN